jgi:WD40 repeat protein
VFTLYNHFSAFALCLRICELPFNLKRIQHLASGSGDQTVRLWTVATRGGSNLDRCLKVIAGFRQEVMAVAFGHAAERGGHGTHFLACGSYDRTIRLWHLSNPNGLAIPNQKTVDQPLDILADRILADRVETVAVSNDGKLLASGSDDQTICLWSLDISGAETEASASTPPDEILPGHSGRINFVAFSPNDRFLASGSFDRTIRLWDLSKLNGVQTARSYMTLTGHINEVNAVTFSPDGQLLASSSRDETIRLWDVQSGACLRVRRPDRPYERMNIADTTGLPEAQKVTLRALGATE